MGVRIVLTGSTPNVEWNEADSKGGIYACPAFRSGWNSIHPVITGLVPVIPID